jgi:hypothetical protein
MVCLLLLLLLLLPPPGNLSIKLYTGTTVDTVME